MAKWRETPEDQRAYAMRLDPATGQWSRCWYSDLRKGDIFKAFAFDGTRMHPYDGDEVDQDDERVALVTNDPVKSNEALFPDGVPATITDVSKGWAVEVIYGPLHEMMKDVAS